MNKLKLKFAFLLIMPFVFSACNDKKPKVKNINMIDLEITGFSIEKNNEPTLKNISFSIDQNYHNKKETAEIYNNVKIENDLDISKVKLNILYSKTSVSHLEYSIGGANFKEFDPQKDSVEIGNNRAIKLKLVPIDNTITPNIYNIEIRQYDYNSGTIDYTKKEKDIDISNYRKIIENGQSVDLYTYDNKNICKTIDKDLNITQHEITGIPSSEKIDNIFYVNQTLAYAISNDGNVYMQKERYSKFNHIKNLTNIKALLGYIKNNTFKIALIQQNENEKARFILFGDDKVTQGHNVPDNFAIKDFYAINDNQLWAGDNIHLFAGYAHDGALNKNCWYTTNGEDWLVSQQNGLPDNIERYSITKYNNQIYYLIVTKDKDVRLFVSSDNGYNWVENPYGLPKDISNSGIKTQTFITFTIGDKYYIVIDKNKKSSVYEGILRRITDK